MNTEATTSPEMTRAAQRYLEQYGDPMVMNTYLKVAVLALSAVAVALTGVVFKSHQALASAKPLIIRIDNVGRAEAIDYRDFQYRPQEAENKYYLGRWAELYFSRNRFTLVRDQTASLYFMNSDVQRDVIEQDVFLPIDRYGCDVQDQPRDETAHLLQILAEIGRAHV